MVALSLPSVALVVAVAGMLCTVFAVAVTLCCRVAVLLLFAVAASLTVSHALLQLSCSFCCVAVLVAGNIG